MEIKFFRRKTEYSVLCLKRNKILEEIEPESVENNPLHFERPREREKKKIAVTFKRLGRGEPNKPR